MYYGWRHSAKYRLLPPLAVTWNADWKLKNAWKDKQNSLVQKEKVMKEFSASIKKTHVFIEGWVQEVVNFCCRLRLFCHFAVEWLSIPSGGCNSALGVFAFHKHTLGIDGVSVCLPVRLSVVDKYRKIRVQDQPWKRLWEQLWGLIDGIEFIFGEL